MSHIELEIISNIVDKRCMHEAKKAGVTPLFFRTPEGAAVFDWLWEQYHDPKHFGEVPNRQRLLRAFPSFEFCPSPNSVNALYTEANHAYLLKDTEQLLMNLNNMLAEGYDAADILAEATLKIRDLQLEATDTDGDFLHSCADQLVTDYETAQSTGGITGIPYPYEPLNDMTGGMQDQDLVYIYGRPGMMKSWLLCVIAAECFKSKRRTMIYTKEVNKITMMKRVISVILGIDYKKYRKGQLDDTQRDAFYEFMSLFRELSEDWEGEVPGMYFVTDEGCKKPRTVAQLMAIAERVKPEVMFVDGMYLMRSDDRSAQKENERVKSISRALKAGAQRLNIPVITTSQANREGKNSINVGDTEDAAFSDGVSQDADVMLRLFKAEHPTIVGGNSLMVVPKKIREGVPTPFVINACPSEDWSIQQLSVDPRMFKQLMDQQEAAKGGRPDGSTTKPFQKPRKKGNFRE